MSNYIWCHGPKCHTNRTQDRVRGSKGSKVLRTRKVKQQEWNRDRFDRFFCSQGCLFNFLGVHIQRIVALDPRTEPLETPIEDPVRERSEYGYYHNRITERGVDTSME